MIGGILFLSSRSVCLFVYVSVCLLSNLTFAITFEPLEIETSYLACILHLWHPFNWHQGQWPCDLDLDLEAKNSFYDFVAAGAYTVFHKHALIFYFGLFYLCASI